MKFGFSEGPWLAISLPREAPFMATIRVHEGVNQAGERIMRAQRVWKPVRPVSKNAEIERFYFELALFNERIQELEKQHPEASKIEALKARALVLARQIDDIRCSSANDLTDLLAK